MVIVLDMRVCINATKVNHNVLRRGVMLNLIATAMVIVDVMLLCINATKVVRNVLRRGVVLYQ